MRPLCPVDADARQLFASNARNKYYNIFTDTSVRYDFRALGIMTTNLYGNNRKKPRFAGHIGRIKSAFSAGSKTSDTGRTRCGIAAECPFVCRYTCLQVRFVYTTIATETRQGKKNSWAAYVSQDTRVSRVVRVSRPTHESRNNNNDM